MSYLDQQFNLRDTVADLSPAVKQAIGEVDVVYEVWGIGDKYKLLISEIGDVCEETKKVIVGETRPESFIDNIRAKLSDENKDKANAVAGEINNKILIPIRDAFKKATMGNLVPNPNVEPRIENQESKIENVKTPLSEAINSQLKGVGQPEDFIDRSALMREIENPTPPEFSTIPYGKTRQTFDDPNKFSNENLKRQGQKLSGRAESFNQIQGKPPINLPTGNETPAEEDHGEIPIIRTMPRDMASRGELVTHNTKHITEERGEKEQVPPSNVTSYKLNVTSSHGKFGHGIPPTIRQNRQNESSEIPSSKIQIPKNPENQQKAPSFIPSKAGFVGGTIRGGGNAQPTRQTFEGQKSSGQATERPAPKPAEIPLEQNLRPTATEKPPVPPTPPTPPAQVTEKPVPKPAEILPQQNLGGQAIPNAPTESAPKETPHTTFQMPQAPQSKPQKTETVNDVVDDKLTKTVNVPSEKKRYVVDPYREPIE